MIVLMLHPACYSSQCGRVQLTTTAKAVWFCHTDPERRSKAVKQMQKEADTSMF